MDDAGGSGRLVGGIAAEPRLQTDRAHCDEGENHDRRHAPQQLPHRPGAPAEGPVHRAIEDGRRTRVVVGEPGLQRDEIDERLPRAGREESRRQDVGRDRLAVE
ncbi:MAG: hypothetical protein DMF81_04425 [Acidobacteria bacterium]|nr:MAG: hypothetical protein DMF81_04425 [Acidobacteriota bacterium]